MSRLVTFSQQERHQSSRSAVRGGSKEGRGKEGEATSAAKEQKSQSVTGERWNPELRQMLQSSIQPSMSRTWSALHIHWCRVQNKQAENKPAEGRGHQLPPPDRGQSGSTPADTQQRRPVGRGVLTNTKSACCFSTLSENNHNTPKQESFAQLRLVIYGHHDDVARQTPLVRSYVTAKKHNVNVSEV